MEALHVMGGLFGAIVVDPLSPSAMPSALLAMRRTQVSDVMYILYNICAVY